MEGTMLPQAFVEPKHKMTETEQAMYNALERAREIAKGYQEREQAVYNPDWRTKLNYETWGQLAAYRRMAAEIECLMVRVREGRPVKD